MKKILFFTLTLSGGGMERLLTDIVNNLDKRRYEITVQTFYDIGIYKQKLAPHIRYKTIISEKNDLIRKIKGRITWMVLSNGFVYKKYIKDGYDIEIAFVEGVPTKLLGMKKTDPNVKRIAWVHTDLFHNHYTSRFFSDTSKEKAAYECYDHIVCVSDSARMGFEKRFGHVDNVLVKYNFIDKDEIKRLAKKEIKTFPITHAVRMISVGRLVPQKGYDRLLCIIRRLLDHGIDCELWVFGDGEERQRLESYVKTHNLQEAVRLCGFQTNPYKYMKYFDLFVCSSRSEGYGLAIAEAMLLGLPVISTLCSGPDEITENGKYGMLVDNDDESLYLGLLELCSNKKLRQHYAKLSLERVEFFSKEERMRDIEELLN